MRQLRANITEHFYEEQQLVSLLKRKEANVREMTHGKHSAIEAIFDGSLLITSFLLGVLYVISYLIYL